MIMDRKRKQNFAQLRSLYLPTRYRKKAHTRTPTRTTILSDDLYPLGKRFPFFMSLHTLKVALEKILFTHFTSPVLRTCPSHDRQHNVILL